MYILSSISLLYWYKLDWRQLSIPCRKFSKDGKPHKFVLSLNVYVVLAVSSRVEYDGMLNNLNHFDVIK